MQFLVKQVAIQTVLLYYNNFCFYISTAKFDNEDTMRVNFGNFLTNIKLHKTHDTSPSHFFRLQSENI